MEVNWVIAVNQSQPLTHDVLAKWNRTETQELRKKITAAIDTQAMSFTSTIFLIQIYYTLFNCDNAENYRKLPKIMYDIEVVSMASIFKGK